MNCPKEPEHRALSKKDYWHFFFFIDATLLTVHFLDIVSKQQLKTWEEGNKGRWGKLFKERWEEGNKRRY